MLKVINRFISFAKSNVFWRVSQRLATSIGATILTRVLREGSEEVLVAVEGVAVAAAGGGLEAVKRLTTATAVTAFAAVFK